MRHLWNRFKNAYFYNMKLRYKLLLSHMVLIILPTIVLTFFLYSKLYDIIVSDTILSEQTLASQTVSTVEASLSLVTQASDSLAASDAVQLLLSLTENTAAGAADGADSDVGSADSSVSGVFADTAAEDTETAVSAADTAAGDVSGIADSDAADADNVTKTDAADDANSADDTDAADDADSADGTDAADDADSADGTDADFLSEAVLSFAQLAENLTDGEVVTGIRLYLDEETFTLLSSAGADAEAAGDADAAGNAEDADGAENTETAQSMADATDTADAESDAADSAESDDTAVSTICALSAVTSTYWYGILSTGEDAALFCPGLYLSATEEETLGSLAYISALQTESGSEAYLAVYFSADALADSLKDDVRTDNSATYILNERDVVVAASSSALSGAYYMTNTDLTELVGSVNQFSTRSYQEDDIYVGYYTIEGTAWHLVSVLSADSLVRKGTLLVVEFAAIYFLFFILAALLTTVLSGSIANRIARLIRQMQSVHHQKPQRIETKEDAKDEIGDLVNTYNYMSDEINALMDSQAQAAEDLKREEYNALQAQINPHFLYNSLDMISWLAKSGRQDDVSRAVQALSRFYKLSLSKKDSVNILETELEHVSLYVQIQNMRFEDRISFVTDVPDMLLECEIPKLTLQPIVENSIQHGIFERPGKSGTILITGWTEGDDLCLLISDDGAGMTPEQLSLVLTDRGKSKGGSHIGVYNTHARIRLLYGEEYGLSYESTLGQGTDVLLCIPAVFPAST